MAKETLRNLFESDQDKLRSMLQDLELPKDAAKIEGAVSHYLNELFDNDGEFRLQLTQAEDYILQSALSLLNAQQTIVSELSKNNHHSEATAQRVQTVRKTAVDGINKKAIPYSIGATAVGGIIGGVVIGTWGAVFGSVAGTAMVLYCASSSEKSAASKNIHAAQHPMPTSVATKQKLDVDKFIQIVASICESIDNLIETFRAQINRVVNKYEQQPKPTLEGNFKSILEGIQSLVGYKRTHDETEDKYVGKLQQRIEDITELLDNYDLQVVDYSDDKANLFEEISSATAQQPKMIVPAITKGDTTVLKGKVFIPEK